MKQLQPKAYVQPQAELIDVCDIVTASGEITDIYGTTNNGNTTNEWWGGLGA